MSRKRKIVVGCPAELSSLIDKILVWGHPITSLSVDPIFLKRSLKRKRAWVFFPETWLLIKGYRDKKAEA